MDVKFYPDSSQNPYLSLLSRNLERFGVSLIKSPKSGRFPIFRTLKNNRSIKVVHIHWMDSLLRLDNKITFIKRAIYLIIEVFILKYRRVKLVWTIHNLIIHDSQYKNFQIRLYHLLFLLCDEVIVHCKKAIDKVKNEYRINNKELKKISIIKHPSFIGYYPDDISKEDARKKLNINPSKFVYLFFGKIRKYKGIDKLIECFNRITLSEKYLLIAGQSNIEDFNKNLQELVCNNCNVKYINKYIPDKEVQVFMKAADVVVLPYKRILTSGSAILAMSFGKPLIAPSMGCLPELIDPEGVLFYDDMTSLRKAMKEIVRKNLDSMGKYNYNKIAKERWVDMAEKVATIYRR